MLVEQALLAAIALASLYYISCPHLATAASSSCNLQAPIMCRCGCSDALAITRLAWLACCTNSSILDDVLLDTNIKLVIQFLLIQLLLICGGSVTPI
jgi:hypothetical protein